MNIPKRHTLTTDEGKYNYLLFDSIVAFNEFVDFEATQLRAINQRRWDSVIKSSENIITKKSDWLGSPAPKSILELEEHRSFLGMPLVKEIQPKIKDKLSEYLRHIDTTVLPKPKIAYNDRGLGVFSFERAAMGLYKSFPLNTQTTIDTSVSQMNIELRNYNIQTSVKSVYAYFKDRNTSYPSLQLYILAGANSNVKGNDLLYVGLACSELVEFMELRGISVEVNVLIGTTFSEQTCFSVVRVKRFQDKLDKNQLLLISSDPRYFRYRGFKALIAMSNYFGLNIPAGLGSMSKIMGRTFVSALNFKSFVFEQSYSMRTAVAEVSKIITNYKDRLDAKK